MHRINQAMSKERRRAAALQKDAVPNRFPLVPKLRLENALARQSFPLAFAAFTAATQEALAFHSFPLVSRKRFLFNPRALIDLNRTTYRQAGAPLGRWSDVLEAMIMGV